MVHMCKVMISPGSFFHFHRNLCRVKTRHFFLYQCFKVESCFLYMDTLIYKIMAENNLVSLFSLSYDTINGMKKKDLVDHIENLKGKVVIGNDIQGLFNLISKLSENVDRLVTANEKLNSELLIVRNVNQNLEETINGICKDSGIDVNTLDIEGCQRLPLGRNAANTTKRVIVKFVNRKHLETMLQGKKDISKKSKVFVSHSLCPYYQFLWGKWKELQRKGQVNQVFCLGAVVSIRITENSPAIKILHEKDLMVWQECPQVSV